MRLIQLVSDSSGEPIGLYTCSKSEEELSTENVDTIMNDFHNLNEDSEYDKADELISANGIERIYVDHEVSVD